MENTKCRIELSFSLSIIFYIVWIFYDFITYINVNRDSTFLLIVCALTSIPIFLYSLYFIRNEFKIISNNVNNYIVYYIIVHITSVLTTILLDTSISQSMFWISVCMKFIAIISTYYISRVILKETLLLNDIDEERKDDLKFQEAIIFGVSSLILSALMLGGIFFVGKNIAVAFIITPFLILILLSNYVKCRILRYYKIIEYTRGLIIDNISIIFASIIALIFSDSTMFDKSSIDKHANINYVVLIISVLFFIPMIKTNKKIDSERKNQKKK